MARPTKSHVVWAKKGPNGEILCHRMGCGKLAIWWEDWERWAIKRWLSTAYCEDHRTGPNYPADSGHTERPVRQPVRAISYGEGKNVDHEVTRYQLPVVEHGSAVERMTGAEANIKIRGTVVNSMNDELWTYEVPNRDGNPLRVVARTRQGSEFVLMGPRTVREVFEQAATSGPVPVLDWLERGAYAPPKPTHPPVKVGERVTALIPSNGSSLGAGLITAVKWAVHPMQSHYQLPPLWTWEWRVTVWFGDDRTREGRWHTDWVGKASSCTEDIRKFLEPVWQELEAVVEKQRKAAAE